MFASAKRPPVSRARRSSDRPSLRTKPTGSPSSTSATQGAARTPRAGSARPRRSQAQAVSSETDAASAPTASAK